MHHHNTTIITAVAAAIGAIASALTVPYIQQEGLSLGKRFPIQ